MAIPTTTGTSQNTTPTTINDTSSTTVDGNTDANKAASSNEKPITKAEAEAMSECKDRFGYTNNLLGEIIFGGKTPYESCTDSVKKAFNPEASPAAEQSAKQNTSEAVTIGNLFPTPIKP